MSDELKAREIARRKIQAARDRGEGSRGVSHYRENSYSSLREPELHSAWESGWRYADEALRGASGGGAGELVDPKYDHLFIEGYFTDCAKAAALNQQPNPAAATVGAVEGSLTYRGWSIHQGRWPEPAWMATGPDHEGSYEGPEDGWVGNGQQVDGSTIHQVMTEIDGWFEENSDEA